MEKKQLDLTQEELVRAQLEEEASAREEKVFPEDMEPQNRPENTSEPGEDEDIEKPNYKEEIAAIIRGNISPKVMEERIMDYHSSDIADSLDVMNETERKRLYRILDIEDLSDIFEYVDEDRAAKYLMEMDIRKQISMISNMDTDKAVDLLRLLSQERREILVGLMDKDLRREMAMVASFSEEQIGSRMTTNFIEIKRNLDVRGAMKSLIEQAAENDNISTIYVVDENEVFYGAINLKDLIIARQTDRLEDLIITSYPYVYAKESIDNCIEWIKDYSEDSIPALDEENRVLGVITSQDLVKVIDEELGEDYAKLAGLTAEEDLSETVPTSIKKRMPWLIILLFLGLFVSTVVGMFEKVVAEVTVAMLFQSLILDMAGNVGTQSLAVTIRVLMDENLTLGQKMRLIWKEFRVGSGNGILLASFSIPAIGLYLHFAKAEPWLYAFAISGCVGAALLIAMAISSLVGTIIPIVFKKAHIDPAAASGPLITTVNDLVAVVTYYSLAWIFLIQMLHY